MEHLSNTLPIAIEWTATIVVIATGIPQAMSLWKRRDTTGISEHTWWLYIVGGTLFLLYGILRHDVGLIATNAFVCMNGIFIVAMTRASRRRQAVTLSASQGRDYQDAVIVNDVRATRLRMSELLTEGYTWNEILELLIAERLLPKGQLKPACEKRACSHALCYRSRHDRPRAEDYLR